MSEYQVKIKGEYADDDGLRIEMPRTAPYQAWHEIPLPLCPDCGGDLVWYEAGYAPGTRKCMGQPLDPPTTILDRRLPQPGDYPDAVSEQIEALTRRRNTCPDEEVATIDREIIQILKPWIELDYDESGGCGSMFSVQCAGGAVYLRRERFYSR